MQAVEASVAWLEKARLTGIRVAKQKDEKGPKRLNKVVVKDPLAPALWARFYGIGTNQPVFVDRDGVPKPALADIGYERMLPVLEALAPFWSVLTCSSSERGPNQRMDRYHLKSHFQMDRHPNRYLNRKDLHGAHL